MEEKLRVLVEEWRGLSYGWNAKSMLLNDTYRECADQLEAVLDAKEEISPAHTPINISSAAWQGMPKEDVR